MFLMVHLESRVRIYHYFDPKLAICLSICQSIGGSQGYPVSFQHTANGQTDWQTYSIFRIKQVKYSYYTLNIDHREHASFYLTLWKVVIQSNKNSKKYDQFLAEYAYSWHNDSWHNDSCPNIPFVPILFVPIRQLSQFHLSQ